MLLCMLMFVQILKKRYVSIFKNCAPLLDQLFIKHMKQLVASLYVLRPNMLQKVAQ